MQIALWGFGIPLATACVAVACLHIWQLVARRVPLAPSASHALMGIGMAAMFLPVLDPVPRPVWAAAFVVLGAWFAAAAVRTGSASGEAGQHVVGCLAMLFMLFAHGHHTAAAGAAAPTHHGGAAAGGGGGLGLLTTMISLAFAAWFLADIARRVTALAGPVHPESFPATGSTGFAATNRGAVAVATPPSTGRSTSVAHLVMSGAMVAMLLGLA